MAPLIADRQPRFGRASDLMFAEPPLGLMGLIASALALMLGVHVCLGSVSRHTFFDDALMFYRYALHMRQTHTIAWDPGGVPVFGVTSLPWLLAVWAGSFVIRDPLRLVVYLSSGTGIAALMVGSMVISRNCRSSLLSRPTVVFPLLAVPLLLDIHFALSFGNGMETMLSVLANFLFLGCALRFSKRTNLRSSLLVAGAGALAVFTRPEMIICVGLIPILGWWLLGPRPHRHAPVATYLGFLGLLLGADLGFNRWYFGSALPLSFYIKAVHGYEGYALYLNPFAYTLFFFAMGSMAWIGLACVAQRRDVRLLTVFGVPLGLTLAYLLTPVQIMGLGGRYYVPLLPFLMVPAALVVDRSMLNKEHFHVSGGRIAAVTAALLLGGFQYSHHLAGPFGAVMAKGRTIYAEPRFVTDSKRPLPKLRDWWSTCLPMSRIAQSVPEGLTLAATEVGVVGALAPETRVLDLAGLNDARTARQGFSMDYVLAQSPAVMWFPHSDYTRNYGLFSSDPRLLERYVVYAGAFDYGLAVRRDVPQDSPLWASIRQVWVETYPGIDMNAYLVRSVSWNPAPVPPQVRAVVSIEP